MLIFIILGVGLLVLLTQKQSTVDPMAWRQVSQFDPFFTEAELIYQLPAGILKRMAWQESRYNPSAVSPKGARGLMQFMPVMYEGRGGFGVGIFDPFDPFISIAMSGKYLRGLYDYIHQKTGRRSWPLALAAYNAGIGNVLKYGDIPPFSETRQYVAAISGDIDPGKEWA